MVKMERDMYQEVVVGRKGVGGIHMCGLQKSHIFFLFVFFPKGWGVTLYINVLLFIVYTHFSFF